MYKFEGKLLGRSPGSATGIKWHYQSDWTWGRAANLSKATIFSSGLQDNSLLHGFVENSKMIGRYAFSTHDMSFLSFTTNNASKDPGNSSLGVAASDFSNGYSITMTLSGSILALQKALCSIFVDGSVWLVRRLLMGFTHTLISLALSVFNNYLTAGLSRSRDAATNILLISETT